MLRVGDRAGRGLTVQCVHLELGWACARTHSGIWTLTLVGYLEQQIRRCWVRSPVPVDVDPFIPEIQVKAAAVHWLF